MLSLSLYLLKVFIAAALLYGYYWIALRNKLFHHYNRFYLLATVIVSILLPLFRIQWWPSASGGSQVIKMFNVVADGNAYMDEVVIRPATRHWTLESLLPFLYGAVALFLLALFIRTLVLIIRLLKQYPVEKIDDLRFVNTSHPATPFSFLRYIFWNSHIDPDTVQGQQVFRHELAHVQERHTYDKLFMNLVLIFYWYNPVFWLIRKELNMIHEFIADRKAVEDSDTAAFAAMVLQAAYPQHRFSITNNFFYSPIKRRLLMLTKNQSPKTNYFGRVLVLPLLALLALAFTLKKQNNQPRYDGKKITVVIDAGHGGSDPGANGGSNFQEKDLTLALTKQIKNLNQNPNIEILLTRESDQTLTPQERISLAQERKADLYISLHLSAGNPQLQENKSGISVYIPGNQNNYFDKSRLLASSLIQFMKNTAGIPVNEEVIQREKGIWILKSNFCPAVLIEAGYLSSPSDLSKITSPAYQQDFARAVLKGIEAYASNNAAAIPTDMKAIVKDTIPGLKRLPQAEPGKNVLYIVDGVEMKKEDVQQLNPATFNQVNVLKDAPAIEKYGPRASGGAVIIETKKTVPSDHLAGVKNAENDLPNTAAGQPIYVLDGKEVTKDIIAAINTATIESINVLKGPEAIAQYGEKGKAGVVLINTKSENSQKDVEIPNTIIADKVVTHAHQDTKLGSKPLFILDDKVFQANSIDELKLSSGINKFGRVDIYYPDEALKQFGVSAKDGAVIFTTEDKSQPVIKNVTASSPEAGTVFTRTDISPQFPGGPAGWKDFLIKNLDAAVPGKDGWKKGKYTVMLNFVVQQDGSLTNIVTENYAGSKTAQHCIELLKKSPRWKPAIQNGKEVAAYSKQPVTFVVE